MALVLLHACVQFGSFVFVFCSLRASAGLLCMLLALPVPSLLLLLCGWRLPTTATAARAAVLLLLPLVAVL